MKSFFSEYGIIIMAIIIMLALIGLANFVVPRITDLETLPEYIHEKGHQIWEGGITE